VTTVVLVILGAEIVINDFKILVVRTSIVFPLLFRFDCLRRPTPCGEEEEQDQPELYLVPLRGEYRSVTGLVVVK
jgi:hypothetical protein